MDNDDDNNNNSKFDSAWDPIMDEYKALNRKWKREDDMKRILEQIMNKIPDDYDMRIYCEGCKVLVGYTQSWAAECEGMDATPMLICRVCKRAVTYAKGV